MSGARYRRKVWVALRSLLDEKAQELDITMEALEIMPRPRSPVYPEQPNRSSSTSRQPIQGIHISEAGFEVSRVVLPSSEQVEQELLR